MLKKTIMFAAVAGMLFALAPAALAQFSTGFEDGETATAYDGAPDGVLIDGQDDWAPQFGTGKRAVYTYPGLVTWAPQSVGAWVDYTAPAHPDGGNQFLGTSGQGRTWHEANHGDEVVQARVDFLNGPEHDFDLYQGAMTSRGDWPDAGDGGPGNSAGFYSRTASNYIPPGEPPREGDWAVGWQVWNAEGVKLENAGGNSWRYDEEPGFDNLTRETWFRLGYTIDMTTRRYTEFYSKNLITGEEWIMTDPQVMWDDPLDDPDMGEQPTDVYILGGSPEDGIPELNTYALDAIGLFNVGNGQVHLFDNLYVGPPVSGDEPGDVDGDGDVDLADVGHFEAQFGMSGLPVPPIGPNSADLDEDGDVDLDDLVFIRDNYGYVSPEAPSAATPEPATMSVLTLGGLVVLRRRRLRINSQQPTRNIQ